MEVKNYKIIFGWEAIKNVWKPGRVPYMCGLFQLIPLFLLTDLLEIRHSTTQSKSQLLLALHC